jgi:CheY-like chemotaxis protein
MMSNSVLVVDDNRDNRDLAQILLECEGFEVRVAEDGVQALCLLEESAPGLILMDVQLPGIDGLELTRRLRQNPRLRDTVIVAFTAYAMPAEKENARAAGCDGYLTKPIDTRTFGQEIRRYIDQGAAAGRW